MNHDEAEVEKSAIIIIEDVLLHFHFIIMKKFSCYIKDSEIVIEKQDLLKFLKLGLS